MAIAFDASAMSEGGSATSRTWSHTCSGSDLILFVGALTGSGDIVTGATHDGSAMTFINKRELESGNWIYLFYIVAPATGAKNIVVSQSSSGYIQCASASYTGAKQTGQPDSSTTSYSASTSSLTTTTTTSEDSCWLIEVGRAMDTVSIGAGSGTVLRVGNYLCCILDSNGARSAGSQSLVFTGSVSGRMGAVMAAIKPASAAASPTSSLMMMGCGT